MTHIPYSSHVGVAKSHLGDPAPKNTCVQLGMRAWPHELGLATLDTNSVSDAEQRARNGYNGWRYVEGTDGIKPGYYGDWKSSILGPTAADPNPRHVCVMELIQGGRFRGIGAGGPLGVVAHQPKSGGMNPLSYLRGYFIPPTETVGGHTPEKPSKPVVIAAPTKGGAVYRVVKGDTVWSIAKKHKITQRALLNANPRKAGQARNADFHIWSPSLIYIGQRLHIPT